MHSGMLIRVLSLGAALALGLICQPWSPVRAADVTLNAMSFVSHDLPYSWPLLELADRVNKAGKGLHVDVKPDGTMSPFAIGNAVKTGVVDLAVLPFTFYQNLLPIGDAMKLATRPDAELQKNGTIEFLDQLHMQKVNAHMLALYGSGVKFYLYLRDKKIDGPDLKGLKMRITPIYRAAFRAFGADVVQMAPGDVYTALERGTIDGYGWTNQDLKKIGWAKYTKYRVEPGFFAVWSNFIVNADTWKKLTPDQQAFLKSEAVAAGKHFDAQAPELNAKYEKEQNEVGVQVIRFDGKVKDQFLKTAYDASWEEAEKLDPVNAAKLRKLISR
jgi:TRAP-type C4-dicarboxylate transport system substrate-binding protein